MLAEITSPSIIYYGPGQFSKIVSEAPRFGNRAVIVTGKRLNSSILIKELAINLLSAGVLSFVASPITKEPTVDMVDDLADYVSAHKAKVLIAIGGGSVMDAAKAAAVVAANDGSTEDYQLRKQEIEEPPLATIFVPTTAGTGSEATRVSVLTNEKVGIKRSLSHPYMTPDVVILDPKLTVSCSPYITAITAMDAFSHAIESAVSRNANAYTRHVALAGIELLSKGLPVSLEQPDNLDARLNCLMGADFAGLAMQQGMGASHSLAPAICIVANIRHGEAIAALLPHAIRLNESVLPDIYKEVKAAMGCDDAAACLERWCEAGGVSNNLASYGLGVDDWPRVLEVMNRYASHRQTNPVEVTDEYARQLYEMAVCK